MFTDTRFRPVHPLPSSGSLLGMSSAPVVVFSYKRPEHTRLLLESLLANPEAATTPLFVYCDGPRSADDVAGVTSTRTVVRALVPHATIVERPANLGLARSVISGVTEVCSRFGRVIVLEDDLILSPTYLAFMNAALSRYADTAAVYHVAGYMYPIELPTKNDGVMLPFINSSGGWATWQRAWSHFDVTAHGALDLLSGPERKRFDIDGSYLFSRILEQQLAGKVDSWAIRWYLSVFLRSGLALFPRRSLAQNIGFGDAATHTKSTAAPAILSATAHPVLLESAPSPEVDPRVYQAVRNYLRRDRHLLTRVARRLRSLVGR